MHHALVHHAPVHNCAPYSSVLQLVIELVLATDMKLHFSLVGQFNAVRVMLLSLSCDYRASWCGKRGDYRASWCGKSCDFSASWYGKSQMCRE